jgi:hypothetical protein
MQSHFLRAVFKKRFNLHSTCSIINISTTRSCFIISLQRNYNNTTPTQVTFRITSNMTEFRSVEFSRVPFRLGPLRLGGSPIAIASNANKHKPHIYLI